MSESNIEHVNCAICRSRVGNVHYKGRTRPPTRFSDSWITMCPPCFRDFGIGLGTGKGQKWVLRGAVLPKWVLV